MTQVPIKVLITNSKLLEHPDINEQLDKLTKAGHAVTIDDSLAGFDFITGPNCWLLRPEVAGLFTLAVTNARKIANADKERVDAHSATQANKRAAKRTVKPSKRKPKVETTIEGQLTIEGTTDGQG